MIAETKSFIHVFIIILITVIENPLIVFVIKVVGFLGEVALCVVLKSHFIVTHPSSFDRAPVPVDLFYDTSLVIVLTGVTVVG